MRTGVNRLLVQLHNPSEEQKISAVIALRKHLDILEVQNALRSCLCDSDGSVRMLAAEALSKEKLFPEDSIPVLMTILDVTDQGKIARIDTSKQWRRMAAGALANYGPKAEPALQLLRNALLDPDINIRGYAAIALGAIGPPSIIALQDLRAARQIEDDLNLRDIYDSAIKKIVRSNKFIVIAEDEQDENQ
jgi:HEAT repeat protein